MFVVAKFVVPITSKSSSICTSLDETYIFPVPFDLSSRFELDSVAEIVSPAITIFSFLIIVEVTVPELVIVVPVIRPSTVKF